MNTKSIIAKINRKTSLLIGFLTGTNYFSPATLNLGIAHAFNNTIEARNIAENCSRCDKEFIYQVWEITPY